MPFLTLQTGSGIVASRLGTADLGTATQSDMRQDAEMISNINPNVPLISDADTGYGGPITVARTVEQYSQSGVAGLHIDDQAKTKRCGHLGGKELVDTEIFAARIRAAVAARKRIGSDIVIIARTSALQSLGYGKALERLKMARHLGADVGFLEGMTSVEMFKQVNKNLAGWPLLLNMVEGGITPTISAAEAQEIGFRIIIHPLASLNAAYQAIKDQLVMLKTTGRMDHGPMLPP
jgi:methylisocitrate lyase